MGNAVTDQILQGRNDGRYRMHNYRDLVTTAVYKYHIIIIHKRDYRGFPVIHVVYVKDITCLIHFVTLYD